VLLWAEMIPGRIGMSAQYTEHQGAYTVVTARPVVDAQVEKSHASRQQDASESSKTAR
jgi:hypothetical protein